MPVTVEFIELVPWAKWDMSHAHLPGGSGVKNFGGSVSLDFGWPDLCLASS